MEASEQEKQVSSVLLSYGIPDNKPFTIAGQSLLDWAYMSNSICFLPSCQIVPACDSTSFLWHVF